MNWSPNFEDNISFSNDLRPTFEQYEQQDNYGLTTLRPKNCTLDLDETVYDDEILQTDARAELELAAFRRKIGYPPQKRELRKWDDQEDDNETDDIEILKVIRSGGQEPEPSPSYRLNMKTTSTTAIISDEMPVCGVKNLYLTRENFKFKNPYVTTPVQVEPSSEKERKSDDNIRKEKDSGSMGAASGQREKVTKNRHSYKDPTIGVAGEQYVSPAALYALKARRNR